MQRANETGRTTKINQRCHIIQVYTSCWLALLLYPPLVRLRTSGWDASARARARCPVLPVCVEVQPDGNFGIPCQLAVVHAHSPSRCRHYPMTRRCCSLRTTAGSNFWPMSWQPLLPAHDAALMLSRPLHLLHPHFSVLFLRPPMDPRWRMLGCWRHLLLSRTAVWVPGSVVVRQCAGVVPEKCFAVASEQQR